MKNKNLLFICPSYPAVGGVETVTCLLTDFFLGKGFNVHLLVSSTEKRCGSILDRHADLMTAMEGVSNSKENLSFIDRFIREKDIACVLNQGVFSEAYLHADCHKDVIFINVLHSCPFWEIKQFRNKSLQESLSAEKNKLRKLKLPLRYVLSRIKPELSHPFLSSFYKRQIDATKYYVVLNQSYKTLLEKRLYHGVIQEKIKVIPDPVVLSDEKAKPKEKIVLYVGRLNQEPKRVDRLLRIWAQIEGKALGWRLQIIGDGPHRPVLERMSAKLHLSKVSFLGWQNPDSFYNSASIVCLTSTYEGFGMVLTEDTKSQCDTCSLRLFRSLQQHHRPGC